MLHVSLDVCSGGVSVWVVRWSVDREQAQAEHLALKQRVLQVRACGCFGWMGWWSVGTDTSERRACCIRVGGCAWMCMWTASRVQEKAVVASPPDSLSHSLVCLCTPSITVRDAAAGGGGAGGAHGHGGPQPREGQVRTSVVICRERGGLVGCLAPRAAYTEVDEKEPSPSSWTALHCTALN